MSIDATMRRWSPAVIFLSLGAAAYFQAVGMGQLVAGVALGATPARAHGSGARPPSLAAGRDRDRDLSAAAILARNPFDSVKGPLLPGGEIEPPPRPPGAGNSGDPYLDPPCDGVRALVIAESGDPEWSFAALVGPDNKTILRRRGDEIDGRAVLSVSDRVWLSNKGGVRCQIELGKAPPKAAPTTPPSPRSGLSPDLAGKIVKTGERSFTVERSAIDAVIQNPRDVMNARFLPEKEGDRVVGVRVSGVRPGSLLATIGIENGDRLESINGFELNDPQKMLEAYAKLGSADHLSVVMKRRGAPMTIDYAIK
jgi:general secretion pathway protein C